MRVSKLASVNSPNAIIIISAERIKSVRIAPLILAASLKVVFSSCSSWAINLCRIFSTPSKHKYAPPIIRSGTINQGKNAESSKAIGIKMTLLTNDPLVTAQTMGNSRSEDAPVT